MPVVCAFHSRNLKSVAVEIRKLLSKTEIVIGADNDAVSGEGTFRSESEKMGLRKAKEAAKAVGGFTICPIFQNQTTEQSNFSDLAMVSGIEEVGRQITKGVAQERTLGWLARLPDMQYDQERKPAAAEFGIKVTTLDSLVKTKKEDFIPSGESLVERVEERKSQVTKLIEIGKRLTLFHDAEQNSYAEIPISKHRENWRLESKTFSQWISGIFYHETGTGAIGTAINDAIRTLSSIAKFDGEERHIFLRAAEHEDQLFIDLCDANGRSIEIDQTGFRLIKNPPVTFVRQKGMIALPEPTPAESIEPLWSFLNIHPDDRPLIAAWLINALRSTGPYLILNLVGEQGSAKSTATRLLRSLVDPSAVPLRSPPREERDLLVSAANNWVVALENLSGIPNWLSDSLCRLSTGGGHSARQLYSDGEEYLINLQRPVIINGISSVALRGDLAERCITVMLNHIPESNRREERMMMESFQEQAPRILGALLRGLSTALKRIDKVRHHVQSLPRMADAALWATAAEPAFGWTQGTFLKRAAENAQAAADDIIEASPVSKALADLLKRRDNWEGTATQLLEHLEEVVGQKASRRNWPGNARALSAALTRLVPALRKHGINVDFSRHNRQRMISVHHRKMD